MRAPPICRLKRARWPAVRRGDAIYLGSGNTGALVSNETLSGGYYGIEMYGTGETLQNGSVTGGFYGGVNAIAPDSVVQNETAFGNNHDGIYSRGAVIDAIAYGNSSNGIESSDGTVTGSTVYGQAGGSSSGLALENSAVGTGNLAYLNHEGIYVASYATATDNIAFDNGDAGILLASANGGTNTVTDNTIYGNATGVGGSLYDGGFGNNSRTLLQGNVIYENSGVGVSVSAGVGLQIVNNTIDQSAGSAIVLSGGSVNAKVENNILIVAMPPRSAWRPTARWGSPATTTCSTSAKAAASATGKE